jgi:hypothetical protein
VAESGMRRAGWNHFWPGSTASDRRIEASGITAPDLNRKNQLESLAGAPLSPGQGARP